MDTHIQQVKQHLTEYIQKTKENVNPVAIIAVGMNFLKQSRNMTGQQKKEILVKVIESIANGKDGIAGTSDDIIPPQIVNAIRIMLQTDLVSQTIDVLSDVTKGRFDTLKKVNWLTCFS